MPRFLHSFLPLFVAVGALQCKNEVGDDVESWEILKFPKSTSYVYSTNQQTSLYDLNSTTEGALAYTMQQLWTPNIQYLVYNDEPPFATTYNFTSAHAKAVFFWDSETAVALFHSIPKFPVGPNMSLQYVGLLPNAWEYAQHIVCVTMTPMEIQTLLPILGALGPRVYGGSLPEPASLHSQACTIQPIDNRLLFAKPATFEVDIWSACVAPYFGTSLQVISWVHGTLDGPVCNVNQTVDITQITYGFGESYTNYNNHAKWGIGEYPLVCFGDLNRVTTQTIRSGAVLCWKDMDVYNSLQSIIADTNTC